MAHSDLDKLFDELLSMAYLLLKKNGEYFPIGAALQSDGEVTHVAGYNGEEHPESKAIIALLVDGLRAQAIKENLLAAGICYDVLTVPPGASEKTDAICINIEHASGECVKVFEPYKKGWFGKFNYGETFATSGDNVIFAGNEDAT